MSKNELNNTSPPAYSLHQHAYLTLAFSDRIRFYRFPPAIIAAIRQTILANWSRGLQKETEEVDFYEFKLKGNPWNGIEDEVVPAKIMMLHVFSALHSHGWHQLLGNDLCRLGFDRNSLIFKLGVPPSSTSFFAIARYQLDKFQMICAPPELIPGVRQIMGEANIQRDEWLEGGACYQLKIRGNLWLLDETPISRIRLLAILDYFASLGWELHTSLYLNGIGDNLEADTWFFHQKLQ